MKTFQIRLNDARQATVADIAHFFDCAKSRAVLHACDHTMTDHRNKRKALEYLETHCAGLHVAKVADILSTRQMPIEYEATVEINPKSP